MLRGCFFELGAGGWATWMEWLTHIQIAVPRIPVGWSLEGNPAAWKDRLTKRSTATTNCCAKVPSAGWSALTHVASWRGSWQHRLCSKGSKRALICWRVFCICLVFFSCLKYLALHHVGARICSYCTLRGISSATCNLLFAKYLQAFESQVNKSPSKSEKCLKEQKRILRSFFPCSCRRKKGNLQKINCCTSCKMLRYGAATLVPGV